MLSYRTCGLLCTCLDSHGIACRHGRGRQGSRCLDCLVVVAVALLAVTRTRCLGPSWLAPGVLLVVRLVLAHTVSGQLDVTKVVVL